MVAAALIFRISQCGHAYALLQPNSEPMPVTVLLIDDDPAVCRALSRLLRFSGFQVLVASSGRNALALVAEVGSEINIVLSDVQMPGLDGHQIAARLSARYPVVLMSGALDQQLSGVLSKPFTHDELLNQINSALCLAA